MSLDKVMGSPNLRGGAWDSANRPRITRCMQSSTGGYDDTEHPSKWDPKSVVHGGFQKLGPLFRSPYKKDHHILESILGSPLFGNFHMSSPKFSGFIVVANPFRLPRGLWVFDSGLGSVFLLPNRLQDRI